MDRKYFPTFGGVWICVIGTKLGAERQLAIRFLVKGIEILLDSSAVRLMEGDAVEPIRCSWSRRKSCALRLVCQSAVTCCLLWYMPARRTNVQRCFAASRQHGNHYSYLSRFGGVAGESEAGPELEAPPAAVVVSIGGVN